MTEREMAAVLLAYANGAQIQSRPRDDLGCIWIEVKAPAWNFTDVDYRVKPQPREWIVSGGRAFELLPGQLPPVDGIYVREVREDES